MGRTAAGPFIRAVRGNVRGRTLDEIGREALLNARGHFAKRRGRKAGLKGEKGKR